MMIIKERLELHLSENDEQNELQSGFTARRRDKDNMFVLRYCVEESFRKKKEFNGDSYRL